MNKLGIVFLPIVMYFLLGQVWASAVSDRTKSYYFQHHPIPKRLCDGWRENSQELKLDFAYSFFQAKITFLEMPILILGAKIPNQEGRAEKILVEVKEVLQGNAPSEKFYLHYFNPFDAGHKKVSTISSLVGQSFYVLGRKVEGKVYAYSLSDGQLLASNHGLCFETK